MSFNKKQLIKEAFPQYDLSSSQEAAIESILDGYITLIEESRKNDPSKQEIKIFIDLIKSNLINIINVLQFNG